MLVIWTYHVAGVEQGFLCFVFLISLFSGCHRKADNIFGDLEIWKNVSDRDRRDLFDDVVHLIAKREKVSGRLNSLQFFPDQVAMVHYKTVSICTLSPIVSRNSKSEQNSERGIVGCVWLMLKQVV